jgi:hypothetical protein
VDFLYSSAEFIIYRVPNDFMSVLYDLTFGVIPSQKCLYEHGLILNGSVVTELWIFEI